ncbi:hypothetical protein FZC66_05705 [Priestia megaterium]|nr:hypothetical protein FZC66_05705 [Priestia megaterium]
MNIDKRSVEKKRLIFKSFGDGIYSLTGGLDIKEASKVNFDLVEADIVSAQSNDLSSINGYNTVFIHKDDVDFIFVSETFDTDLHD